MKRQIFRSAVEKFSGEKLTENMITKNGHGFHDFAMNILARVTHNPILSQDHVYMLNNVLPRTWGLFRFEDQVADTLFDVRGKVLKLLEDEQAKPQGSETIEGLHKYMKPPYPISWIERPHNKEKDTTICYLIEAEPNECVDSTFEKPSLRFIQFIHNPKNGFIALPGVTYIGPGAQPFDTHLDARTYKKVDRERVVDTVISSGNAIMAALLLLNSRSPVFKFAADPVLMQAKNLPPEKRDEFERHLMLMNQKHRAPSVIKFDFTRIMRHGKVGEEAAAHRDMIAHLVRGHFKLRKSGIWYWSHHLRGNILPEGGVESLTPKEYKTVRKTDRSFGLPNGTKLG